MDEPDQRTAIEVCIDSAADHASVNAETATSARQELQQLRERNLEGVVTRAALESVEYVDVAYEPETVRKCAWCGFPDDLPHTTGCKRQYALAQDAGKWVLEAIRWLAEPEVKRWRDRKVSRVLSAPFCSSCGKEESEREFIHGFQYGEHLESCRYRAAYETLRGLGILDGDTGNRSTGTNDGR